MKTKVYILFLINIFVVSCLSYRYVGDGEFHDYGFSFVPRDRYKIVFERNIDLSRKGNWEFHTGYIPANIPLGLLYFSKKKQVYDGFPIISKQEIMKIRGCKVSIQVKNEDGILYKYSGNLNDFEKFVDSQASTEIERNGVSIFTDYMFLYFADLEFYSGGSDHPIFFNQKKFIINFSVLEPIADAYPGEFIVDFIAKGGGV